MYGELQRVDFQSGVFHPSIDYYTGELDTKQEFPRWRYVEIIVAGHKAVVADAT